MFEMGKANYKDNVSMVQDTQKRSLTQNFSVLCLISDHIFSKKECIS